VLGRFQLTVGFSGGNSADSPSLDVDDGSSMRTSKSDTSLTDSFVMVADNRKRTVNPMNVLRPGKIRIEPHKQIFHFVFGRI
jgi:hypothetical protein